MYEMPHVIQKQQTTLSGGMAQELQASFEMRHMWHLEGNGSSWEDDGGDFLVQLN